MNTLLLLLTVHFISDFLLQSDWMAINKSKSWEALAWHVAVYSLPFFFLVAWLTGDANVAGFFWMITFITHFLTDAVTSRITSRLWFLDMTPSIGLHRASCDGFYTIKPTRHWFFVMIGFDQLIHFWSLAWTWKLLSGQ